MKNITAKIARERSLQAEQNELSEILDLVDEESLKTPGIDRVRWYADISEINKSVLRDRGFRLEFKPTKDDSWCDIIWGEVE